MNIHQLTNPKGQTRYFKANSKLPKGVGQFIGRTISLKRLDSQEIANDILCYHLNPCTTNSLGDLASHAVVGCSTGEVQVCIRCIQKEPDVFCFPSYWVVSPHINLQDLFEHYSLYDFIEVKDPVAIHNLLEKMKPHISLDDPACLAETYLN